VIAGCASETTERNGEPVTTTGGAGSSGTGGGTSPDAGGATDGTGSGNAGASGASGATGGNAGASGALVDSGADASACWHPLTIGGSAPGKPSEFDASTFGCYPPSRVVRDSEWSMKPGMPFCPGWHCGEPRELLCGACTEPTGYACWTNIWAACDCGQGPFLDQYEDVWICKCESGQWECRLVGPSGSSCQICSTHPDAGP
jgi:hypothetical protein